MVPLTVHSHYSLMQGTEAIGTLCRAARDLGYRRMALTDTDNLYGLWFFLTACRREGITPIVGAEITAPETSQRAVCLVENDVGYANLCRLLTLRHRSAAFDLQNDLIPLADGLTVLVYEPQLLQAWYRAEVRLAAAMPRNPLPYSHPLCVTARKHGVPLVAVPDSFFLQPEALPVHRLLRAIADNTVLSRLAPHQVMPEQAWLAPPHTYAQRFAICPEAIENTHRIAERLTFSGPHFGLVLPPWRGDCRKDALQALRHEAYAGAQNRYGRDLPEAVVQRLEHELNVIAQMGFAAYFLVVQEIVSHSPRTCGRGSGAASLVAYCLGITNVCPIKYNLYFERFLNPGRTDAPDIDVDFAWDERDSVLQNVFARFPEHAAMVANHVLFQPRMAIREVAKVYGLGDGEMRRVAKRLPWFWRARDVEPGLLVQLRQRPESRHIDFAPPWPEILHLAAKIAGTPRYLSVHPGGVIITPEPINRYVPIETAPKGVPIIQWEKDSAEEAGLVKIDLLGNRSLGVIRDTIANMYANTIAFDERRWEPEEDFDTQQMVSQGKTMGCFYIESPATRLLQQKAGQGDFEHLVIHSSIIRPAANDFIQAYLHRLHGGDWEPIHPLLTDILEETFGIMVYQEDVSRAATALAGFTPAEADGLRKVMAKKDQKRQLKHFHTRFSAGARARGISEDKIAEVWEMMMSFSGYSFCKPHSASYARVSFQSAYLKTHYPAEFMAAVISNQGGFYSTFAYVSEARRLGLTILTPSVNRSDIAWKGKGKALRVGLMAVNGLSAPTRARIVACRAQTPYRNAADFFDRVHPDINESRLLIHCGSLDELDSDANRSALMWQLTCRQRNHAVPQPTGKLFDDSSRPEPPPLLPPPGRLARLRQEYAVLGFLCLHHPMEIFASTNGPKTIKANRLGRHVNQRICLKGWLITGKLVRTKQGDPMKFLTFEDETGIVETTFFPKVYHRFCHLLDHGKPYLLNGRVEQNWGALTLTVDYVEILTPSTAQAAA